MTQTWVIIKSNATDDIVLVSIKRHICVNEPVMPKGHPGKNHLPSGTGPPVRDEAEARFLWRRHAKASGVIIFNSIR